MNTQPECVSRGNSIPFMSRKLGQNVGLKLSRAHRTDPQARLKDDCETLVKEQVLRCVLDVPLDATDIEVVANLTKAETNDKFVKVFRTWVAAPPKIGRWDSTEVYEQAFDGF